MLSSQAIRSASSVNRLIAGSAIGRVASARLAPSLITVNDATQIRSGSSGPGNAPWVKNIFKQNDLTYVKPKVEWRNKPEKTDGDLPAFWFFGGLVVIMVALIRFMSIITGGDTPKEPAYRPKRLDKCE